MFVRVVRRVRGDDKRGTGGAGGTGAGEVGGVVGRTDRERAHRRSPEIHRTAWNIGGDRNIVHGLEGPCWTMRTMRRVGEHRALVLLLSDGRIFSTHHLKPSSSSSVVAVAVANRQTGKQDRDGRGLRKG